MMGRGRMMSELALAGPRPGTKRYVGIGAVCLSLGLCLLLTSCVSKVEVMQAKSPDQSLTAQVMEINGGATTDFGYRVDLVGNSAFQSHRTVASFDGAGRSDCAYGVNIRWVDDNSLLITYKDARRAHVDPSLDIAGRTVRIISRSGINDPTAACGGMEYSQHGKVLNVR